MPTCSRRGSSRTFLTTAYQAMLSRRNEKGLIFSLNHRVLQLNSLIDTGIEVARLNQDITPEQMALQRAASLTNASRGTVTVDVRPTARCRCIHSRTDQPRHRRKS